MSVENNQDVNIEDVKKVDELSELKEYARDLGLTVHPKVGLKKLTEQIEAKEREFATQQGDKKKKRTAVTSGKKVKIIVESREGDDAPIDQFIGYQSMETGAKENILIMFGEEIDVSEAMYEHIKSIKFGEKKSKLVLDEDGIPQKVWYTKKKTRFIVSKV